MHSSHVRYIILYINVGYISILDINSQTRNELIKNMYIVQQYKLHMQYTCMLYFLQIMIKDEDGCSQQHKVDIKPLATLPFRDFSFSHSDASISRKFCLVYPWECWNKFLVYMEYFVLDLLRIC